ncbi:PCL2 [Cyberlindnera jadinii]|uniref:Cyclin n=1 Tax=Cyberlindnera jadinii (strain ATCC 18201 / CBS 1600 / BCRC 20928 / JCM 3617 / NBRC 0987 / NRRL Y-1542) TaxID=983966 RepID=A0A0H5C359_CYBJN|nr:cyclin [Cyberlindnera jadinii NRRL Y-1542]ODV75309.1 cyclin [Cyberlindnera jadinii NRRL Y-1542]CEP22455.1 PCL2 [Cyberlindnera jadinii]
MSDKEALLHFQRKRVSSEMVQYLVDVTNSLIKVKTSAYPSPPSSPCSYSQSASQPVPLFEFIRRLIKHSNVQTPTLMSTLVYLARLKAILPSNVYGIETTRHRIFLGCLILTAKSLNDSSPINKHWTAYTDGLLQIEEVNTIERELLEYLNWDLTITNDDLIASLGYFLEPIKMDLKRRAQEQLAQRQKLYYTPANTTSTTRLSALLSATPRAQDSIVSASSSLSSMPSLMSASSSRSTLSSLSSAQSNSSLHNHLRQPPVLLEEVQPLKTKNMNVVQREIKKPASSFNSLVNAGTLKV